MRSLDGNLQTNQIAAAESKETVVESVEMGNGIAAVGEEEEEDQGCNSIDIYDIGSKSGQVLGRNQYKSATYMLDVYQNHKNDLGQVLGPILGRKIF